MTELTGPERSGPSPRPRRPAALEVQYHPADIRRALRTWQFSGAAVGVLGGGVLFLVLAILGGLATLPWSVRTAGSRQEMDRALAERGRLGERLLQMVGRLEELHEETEKLRRDRWRMSLVYDLGDPQSVTGEAAAAPAGPPVAPQMYQLVLGRAHSLLAEAGDRIDGVGRLLQRIEAHERDPAARVREMPARNPLRVPGFVLTRPFGMQQDPFTGQRSFHAGLDLAAPVGTPIAAPADGVVTFAGRAPRSRAASWWRYGTLVVLRHGDRLATVYGHCERVLVRRGQRVEAGQEIATVGNTGWSTNPHLHYEVQRRNEAGEYWPQDPRIYVLDHLWDEREELLMLSRRDPGAAGAEPLPRALIGR